VKDNQFDVDKKEESKEKLEDFEKNLINTFQQL